MLVDDFVVLHCATAGAVQGGVALPEVTSGGQLQVYTNV